MTALEMMRTATMAANPRAVRRSWRARMTELTVFYAAPFAGKRTTTSSVPALDHFPVDNLNDS